MENNFVITSDSQGNVQEITAAARQRLGNNSSS
jgi:hypothetical protein